MMKTDIKETEKAFELDIDLPGFKKENVHAELQDGYLTVSANTETETEDKDEQGTEPPSQGALHWQLQPQLLCW